MKQKSNRVFVLNPDKTSAMPCTPRRARRMLESKKAAVFRMQPFTIILKQEPSDRKRQIMTLGVDVGTTRTGMAIAVVGKKHTFPVFTLQIEHRQKRIKRALLSRTAHRGNLRNRKGHAGIRTNKPYVKGEMKERPGYFGSKLPPSIEHIMRNIEAWVRKLHKLSRLSATYVEYNKFTTGLGIKPMKAKTAKLKTHKRLEDVYGKGCFYCNAPGKMTIDHVIPRAKHGRNTLRNLVPACSDCNGKKSDTDLKVYDYAAWGRWQELSIRLPDTEYHPPTIMNRLMKVIEDRLTPLVSRFYFVTVDDVRKMRKRLRLPKTPQGLDNPTHHIDAYCAAALDLGMDRAIYDGSGYLLAKSMGHGTRQRIRCDGHGQQLFAKDKNGNKIPDGFKIGMQGTKISHCDHKGKPTGSYVIQYKLIKPSNPDGVPGYHTGDIMKILEDRKAHKAGSYRVQSLHTASQCLNYRNKENKIKRIHKQYCTIVQHRDGYSYSHPTVGQASA